MLTLHTWGTPNGRKVSIMLEELGVPYVVSPVDITKGQQFDATYVALNFNSKIPVLEDDEGPDGRPLILAESGAILIYLAQKFCSPLLPEHGSAHFHCLQWLMFQMGGVGPIFGQLHHFKRYAQTINYGLDRYGKEVHRLYGVMGRRLATSSFLAGDDYTIADIATYPWVARYELHDMDWATVPNVRRWFETIGARAAVVRGMKVPRS
jgi:GST-like protein